MGRTNNGMTPDELKAIPHSAACDRGSKDVFQAVYGKADPDCPNCKAFAKIRRQVERGMFA
jgi:hypothetical protein